MEEKNVVLDIIIEFIKACKGERKAIEHRTGEGEVLAIQSTEYLLGQIIRQYAIDISHHFVSVAAMEKWKKISSEPIFKYWYRMAVTKTTEGVAEVEKCVGSSKKFMEIKLEKGDTFIFRDVFHDEHIVPVNMIIKELVKLQEPNYSNVKEILDKIYVCRMLKTEDRNIKNKSKRSLDYEKVIANEYRNVGIEVKRMNSWDQKF